MHRKFPSSHLKWVFKKATFAILLIIIARTLFLVIGTSLGWQWIMLFHQKIYLALHFLVVEPVTLLIFQPLAFFSWLLVKSPSCYL